MIILELRIFLGTMVERLSYKQKVIVYGVFFTFCSALVWGAYSVFMSQDKTYYLNFETSVNGLKQGSCVTYKGVEVGSVHSMEVDLPKADLIKVTIRVKHNFPVYSNYVGILSLRGLTGYYTIDLTKKGSSDDQEPLASGSFIKSEPSPFDNLANETVDALRDIKVFMKKVNAVFTDEKLNDIYGAFDSLVLSYRTLANDMLLVSDEAKKGVAQLFKRVNKNMNTITNVANRFEQDYATMQVEIVQRLCALSVNFDEWFRQCTIRADSKTGFWRFFIGGTDNP